MEPDEDCGKDSDTNNLTLNPGMLREKKKIKLFD